MPFLSLLQLRSLLEEPSNSSEPQIYRMLKRVYEACMDTQALEGRELGGLNMFRRMVWSRQRRR